MSGVIRTTPFVALPSAGSPQTKANYYNRLLVDFQTLLRASLEAGQAPGTQPQCNPEFPSSAFAGCENRSFAGAPQESRDAAPELDPLAMSLASPGGGMVLSGPDPAPPTSGANPAGGATFDAALAAEVLQRVAWGGDRRRGVARLELGGELAGTVVVVSGEGREVTLELSVPAGVHAETLPERLSARLAARGLVVRELVVR